MLEPLADMVLENIKKIMMTNFFTEPQKTLLILNKFHPLRVVLRVGFGLLSVFSEAANQQEQKPQKYLTNALQQFIINTKEASRAEQAAATRCKA